jgi:hypothetical protein
MILFLKVGLYHESVSLVKHFLLCRSISRFVFRYFIWILLSVTLTILSDQKVSLMNNPKAAFPLSKKALRLFRKVGMKPQAYKVGNLLATLGKK